VVGIIKKKRVWKKAAQRMCNIKYKKVFSAGGSHGTVENEL
jgi:hypothetical protein